MYEETLEYLEPDQKEIIIDEAALRADKRVVIEYTKLRDSLEGWSVNDGVAEYYVTEFRAVMRGMFKFMLDMGLVSERDYIKQMDEVKYLSDKAYKEVVKHVS